MCSRRPLTPPSAEKADKPLTGSFLRSDGKQSIKIGDMRRGLLRYEARSPPYLLPATPPSIQVVATYNDLGATIEGPQADLTSASRPLSTVHQ
jgi:hypothetical protein